MDNHIIVERAELYTVLFPGWNVTLSWTVIRFLFIVTSRQSADTAQQQHIRGLSLIYEEKKALCWIVEVFWLQPTQTVKKKGESK